MTDLISRSAAIDRIAEFLGPKGLDEWEVMVAIREIIENAPAVDAVPVVRCECCALHGHCVVEDSFTLAGFTDGYCRAGKRLSNAVSGARTDSESEGEV